MTRFLSHALEAPEPFFRLGLRRLEAANGHPSTDVRFSAGVIQSTKSKLTELGLDPHDTTPKELYQALQRRIEADDRRLTRNLRTLAAKHVSAEANAVDGMILALNNLPENRRCFALKNARLKTLLRRQPPKRAMKSLGYRSLDSFLKHETPLLALSAAWLTENDAWKKRLLEQYKQLSAQDFEDRPVQLVQPKGQRWQQLASTQVAQRKHSLLSFKEMGAVVFLPLPGHAPTGSVTASLGLALHSLNDIQATSTFLKLCQVRPDFGEQVQQALIDQPTLKSRLLDQPVPWQLVQRYYAKLKTVWHEAFEPHLQLEDMTWQPIEETLAQIDSDLAFWQGTAHLGMLHKGRPVSMNIVDAALNYCNQVPFERRLVYYFQHSLWSELMLRYLKHKPVEDSVMAELQPAVAEERVLS